MSWSAEYEATLPGALTQGSGPTSEQTEILGRRIPVALPEGDRIPDRTQSLLPGCASSPRYSASNIAPPPSASHPCNAKMDWIRESLSRPRHRYPLDRMQTPWPSCLPGRSARIWRFLAVGIPRSLESLALPACVTHKRGVRCFSSFSELLLVCVMSRYLREQFGSDSRYRIAGWDRLQLRYWTNMRA